MPSYFPKQQDTTPLLAGDFAKILSPVTEAATTITVTIPGGGAQHNIHWLTDAWVINSDAWESGGTFTCKLRITTTSNCRARCQIRRISRAGVVLDTGTFTAFQNLANSTTFTFTPAVPTWSANEDCGNRLVIRFNFDEQLTGSGANATIELGTTNTEITTTITENNGNCRRVWIA